MIKLTKLNGQEVVVNAELIEQIERHGNESVLFLSTGNRIVVRESVDEIIDKVYKYRGLISLEMEKAREKIFQKKEEGG